MLLAKLNSVLSKAFFCFRINSDLLQAILFIRNSKKYSSKYKKNQFLGKENKEKVKYCLLLLRKKIPIYIRTYSGDFDIFYEIFFRKVYQIPNMLFSPGNKNIVDLGANIGLTSLFFALQYPDAEIYSLEAEGENYKVLEQNVSFLKNIKPKYGAIDINDGKVFLSSPDLSYNFKVSDKIVKNGREIQAYSMFSFMDLCGINHIDLLKIDIEGLEQSLLQYNNEWLKQVDNIIIELHEPYEVDQLKQDLLPFGFKILSPSSFKGLKMIYATKNNI